MSRRRFPDPDFWLPNSEFFVTLGLSAVSIYAEPIFKNVDCIMLDPKQLRDFESGFRVLMGSTCTRRNLVLFLGTLYTILKEMGIVIKPGTLEAVDAVFNGE